MNDTEHLNSGRCHSIEDRVWKSMHESTSNVIAHESMSSWCCHDSLQSDLDFGNERRSEIRFLVIPIDGLVEFAPSDRTPMDRRTHRRILNSAAALISSHGMDSSGCRSASSTRRANSARKSSEIGSVPRSCSMLSHNSPTNTNRSSTLSSSRCNSFNNAMFQPSLPDSSDAPIRLHS